MSGPVDESLNEMMAAVFADFRSKNGARTICDDEFWALLNELGLGRLTGSEATGGSGAGWREAAALLRTAAYYGVRAPFAEHDLLACWLLERLEQPVDDARRTVCVIDEKGSARRVPWASRSDRVVVVHKYEGAWMAADVDVNNTVVTPGVNLAGEPRDSIQVERSALRRGVDVPSSIVESLRLRGALARSTQICGALDRMLELAIEHSQDRIQFGRPVAKFPAVQHLLADISAEAALAHAATEAALSHADDSAGSAFEFSVAAAKSCTGHAATAAVRNAHQVHGAIGTTQEHRLHEFTNAALAWRSEFGSTRHWDEQLTRIATASGRQGLWALISA